jgi:succinoglycan biosynthesis protein ExoA
MKQKNRFSIVVAVAPDRNAEVIESLKETDYPKDRFEIIVEGGLNPSENRNRGAEKATGDIIAFIDDDAYVDKDLLKNADEFFKKNENIDVVGGPQLTPHQDYGFAKISGYALSSLFGAWKISGRYSAREELLDADETCITSANLFCRREVMNKIKFDIKLFPGEDPKFISDAKKSGFKIAYSPKLIVYHKRRTSIKTLYKQIFSYGRARPLKENFSESIKMPFFFIPSLFLVYTVFLLIFLGISLFSRINGIFIIIILIPLILYVLLLICFTILDSIKNKDYKAIFFLPSIYPLIHFSYGLGMICGYINKMIKK